MTAPLTRDQQIELMLGAEERHKARFAAWMQVREIRGLVCRPASGQSDGAGYEHSERRIACC